MKNILFLMVVLVSFATFSKDVCVINKFPSNSMIDCSNSEDQSAILGAYKSKSNSLASTLSKALELHYFIKEITPVDGVIQHLLFKKDARFSVVTKGL